jgi:2-keto-4-pentenoate hydratase/2-oxohepta-3-ene-1,7-dioic acid hydratase in catechol pathway
MEEVLMRFYTVIRKEKEEIAVAFQQGNIVYPLKKLGFDFKDMNDLICNMTVEQYELLKDIGNRDLWEYEVLLSDVEICAPIITPRQDVICLGINYDEHAIEAGKFSDEFAGKRPYTIYFSKRVNKATPPGGIIPAYEGFVDSLDYEVELGVILGKDVKEVTPDEALDAVFGYTIINDVSARNVQTRHKQWYLGKSLDGFTPIGPCIVTADEIKDPQNLDVKCLVNGQLRQSSNTKYMIQTVAGAISELSQGMTLLAGTIIATGTPSGVGMGMDPPCFLKKGDVITCEIEHIGVLENTVK